MSSLLPPNASRTERVLAELASRATDLPIPIATLLNPQRCPAHVLPWLAWAMSVDYWDESWSETQQRAVIRASFAVHQTKGTVAAVKTAIGALGYRATIKQWWQLGWPAYTFNVLVFINDRPIDTAALQSLHSVVTDAKNARSAYLLSLATEAKTALKIATAVMTSRTVRAMPWQPTSSSSAAVAQITTGLVQHTKIRVTPQ